jgi:hypothetical protein
VDSYLKFWVFVSLSQWLSHDGRNLVQFLEEVPPSSLHSGLGRLDYRKSLTADIMANGSGLFPDQDILQLSGPDRVVHDVSFRSLESAHFKDFNPYAFLRVRCSIPPISSLLLQVLM